MLLVQKLVPWKTILSKVSEYIVKHAKANNFSVRHMIEGDKEKGKDQTFPSYLFNKIGSSVYGGTYLFAYWYAFSYFFA